MSIFSLKPDPVIGVDISSTAIKLLELSKAGKGYKVESYAIETLPEKAMEDKNINEVEQVGDAIGLAVKRAKPKTLNAAVAVAGPAVITKIITMDKGMSAKDMKEQIESDPATYLGQDIEDVHLDFLEIGDNEQEPEDRIDLSLVACRTETIEALQTALEVGGLKTLIVDIEKYALENAFVMTAKHDPQIKENEIIALIEVGATTTTMSVLGEQKVVYTHEEMFGGKQLTEQIQAQYELSYEEADNAQRQGLPDDYQTELLEPFEVEMAQQINRMVQYYYSTSSYGKLSHILIAGGCASPGIVKQVNDKVGGRVTIINPLASMSVATRVGKRALMNDAPALMTACGLALRTFDEYWISNLSKSIFYRDILQK